MAQEKMSKKDELVIERNKMIYSYGALALEIEEAKEKQGQVKNLLIKNTVALNDIIRIEEEVKAQTQASTVEVEEVEVVESEEPKVI